MQVRFSDDDVANALFLAAPAERRRAAVVRASAEPAAYDAVLRAPPGSRTR
jgi:hypothetical protein